MQKAAQEWLETSEYDLETAQEIKKNLPNTVIALCGPHATYFHKDILEKYKFIDIIIRNEFEYTTLNLCKSLKDKHEIVVKKEY